MDRNFAARLHEFKSIRQAEQPHFDYNAPMTKTKTKPSPFPFPPKRIYYGASIPMRLIRRYARAIADEFHPDKIILFGSHAYGTPHDGSDVDLLVIMPARDRHDQAVRIRWRLSAPFPLDLLVRTPGDMAPRGRRVVHDDHRVPR